MDTLVVILIVLVAALLAVLAMMVFRRPQGADLSAPLQNLTQAVQQGQAQTAVLAEKIARLEPVPPAVSGVQVELRGLSERVSTVEQSQSRVSQGIAALGTDLAQTGTAARSLVEQTIAIQSELSRAKNDLTELQTYARARQELEQQIAESTWRLEAIISGTQSKGAAGENILEAVFAKLPPEWQVRNFRVGNKTVEFGLRLPNNLVLPIDSKWAATNLLEQFAACADPAERQKLKAQIELAVLDKAKEVRKYVDPNITVSFGIAAVPDAVYDLCSGIQAEVFQWNVVIISYSMFVPYLLLVFQTMLRTSQSIDVQKLNVCLQSVQQSLKALQEELEGRFSRAITMLGNSREDMRAQLSRVSGGLANLQVSAAAPPAAVLSPEPDSLD